jgi:hypothetical protein
MSYSFSVLAANKALAIAAAAAEIDKQIAPQRAHDPDRAAISGACAAFINSLPQPKENEDVHLTCYGSSSGEWSTDGQGLVRMKSTDMTVKVALLARADV